MKKRLITVNENRSTVAEVTWSTFLRHGVEEHIDDFVLALPVHQQRSSERRYKVDISLDTERLSSGCSVRSVSITVVRYTPSSLCSRAVKRLLAA